MFGWCACCDAETLAGIYYDAVDVSAVGDADVSSADDVSVTQPEL